MIVKFSKNYEKKNNNFIFTEEELNNSFLSIFTRKKTVINFNFLDSCILNKDNNNYTHQPSKCHIDLYEIDISDYLFEELNLIKFLSIEEIQIVNKLTDEKWRNDAIISLGIRRIIISSYLGVPPSQVIYYNNKFGKPFIKNINPKNFSFNVSHSKDKLVVIIGNGCDVGVDIQYVDRYIPILNLARRYFSKQDYKYISSLSRENAIEVFFQLWTSKEAYVKAIGTGFNIPIQSIKFPHLPFQFYEEKKMCGKFYFRISFKISNNYSKSLVISPQSKFDPLR